MSNTILKVCDIVTYKGASYRVTGFAKFIKTSGSGCEVYESTAPENATHVEIYGVCGHILPVGEVEMTGTVVDWSSEWIAQEEEKMRSMIGERWVI